MSLSGIPDELILEIYKRLITFKNCTGSDEIGIKYLNLALTCKRFLRLAQTQFNQIMDREFATIPAVHDVKITQFRDTHNSRGYPRKFKLCPSHGLCGDQSRCHYRRLYPILAFKHINYTQISIGFHDFAIANCLLAMEPPLLDRITRLYLWRCTLDSRMLANLVGNMQNLCHMRLHRNEYYDDDEPSVPRVEKTLWYLELLEDGETGHEHPLLHHNIKLPAKRFSTALSGNTTHNWKYLKRFQDHIEHLEMQASLASEWCELAREHGLAELSCKITWA